MQLLPTLVLCRPHGPSEIEKKFHGVKMMGCWNHGPGETEKKGFTG
jgi:hypothetical protein